MKLSLDLSYNSSQAWIDTVINDFDSFLQDHADCERKASSMAMSFVAKFPDRLEIIPELIETAIEELEHFRDVYTIMENRGVSLGKEMGRDPYMHALIKYARSGREERFMDRLLIASIVECRGAERFRLIAGALPDAEPELQQFYKRLWISEAKHGHIFVKMALNYFPEDEVLKRLHELNDAEGEVVKNLPLRAALH